MKTIELRCLNGDYEINSTKDYVVFTGPQLAIFRTNGEVVARRQDFGLIRKCVFVKDDSILLDCSAKGCYILISLMDGSEKCRIPQPRSDYTCSRFVSSPDDRYVYDRCDLRGKDYLVEINLTESIAYAYLIKHNLRCVSDLVCTQQGKLVFLEQHYEDWEDNAGKCVSKNGMICASSKGLKHQYSFEQVFQWEFAYPRISRFFLGNEDAILTKDLHVYKPSSGELYSLVDNELDLVNLGKEPVSYRFDRQTKYLTLMYDTANIIVDCTARKVIAQYAANYRFGSIVGNEYWVCTDEGIRKMPFPFIECIPTRKQAIWSPWH